MNTTATIRRRVTARTVVIDAAVIETPGLSPAALGLYVVIAAADPAGLTREQLLDRYGGNASALDHRLTELARRDLIEGVGR